HTSSQVGSMDASTVRRTVRTGSSSPSGSSRSSPADVHPRMYRPNRSSDLSALESSPTVASMVMGFEVSQLRKSGSVNENHREERVASTASSNVDLPLSPAPIKQQKDELGFQSRAEIPRKFETFSSLICMRSLLMVLDSFVVIRLDSVDVSQM